MKTWMQVGVVVAVYALFVGGGTGCGGGDDSSSATNVVTNAAAASITGSWNGSEGGGTAFSMHLAQSGDTITGTISKSGYTENITGSISGDAVSLHYSHTTTPPLALTTSYTYTGNANTSRNNMAGSLSKVFLGVETTDSWNANK
jgi:hypothetical protein